MVVGEVEHQSRSLSCVPEPGAQEGLTTPFSCFSTTPHTESRELNRLAIPPFPPTPNRDYNNDGHLPHQMETRPTSELRRSETQVEGILAYPNRARKKVLKISFLHFLAMSHTVERIEHSSRRLLPFYGLRVQGDQTKTSSCP